MQFIKEEYVYEKNARRQQQLFAAANEKYSSYLQKSYAHFPSGARYMVDALYFRKNVSDRIMLHDEPITSIEYTDSKRTLRIDTAVATINCKGVTSFQSDPLEPEEEWLYEEIGMEGNQCVLRVLTTGGELEVKATDIAIQEH